MGGGHGGTRDGVDGVLAANPGGHDVKTRGEDVVALSVVGEVGTLVSQRRGTNGDGLLSGSWGVVTGVGVVVASGNSEVETSVNSGVDSEVEGDRLATTQAHVGGTALEALLLALSSGLDATNVRFSSELNTLDDIGHGAGAVGAEDLDSVDVRLLGNTVLLTTNSTGAVGAVTVAILILVTLRDSLAPFGAALEVYVLSVGTRINDVDVDALATVIGVEVLVEGAETKTLAVGNTG